MSWSNALALNGPEWMASMPSPETVISSSTPNGYRRQV